MAYQKLITLHNLAAYELAILENIIKSLGYTNSKDYRINYYSNSAELVITNRDLHKQLKVIRKTKYSKPNLKGIEDAIKQ